LFQSESTKVNLETSQQHFVLIPEKCALRRLRGGAEYCAVIASVTETCKLNDGDPLA